MTWVAFREPKEGEVVKCTTCNDYGGIYDNETWDFQGMPHEMQCPDCTDYGDNE